VELSDQLYSSIIKYSKRISRYSRQISPDFSETTLHTFRTHIKKFRALDNWQNIDKMIWPRSFKKCYQISGEIRDAQLFLRKIVLEKLEVPALALWLATRIGYMEQDWNKLYRKNKWENWAREIKRELFSFEQVQPGSFYDRQMNKLRHLISINPVTENDIHDGRKAIKNIQYVAAWHEKKQPGDQSVKMPLDNLKEMSDAAGEYIDQVKELHLLSLYLQKENDEEQKKAATELENSLVTQKQIKQMQVLNAIRSFDFFQICPE
jgi:CHAD domain-containing protein